MIVMISATVFHTVRGELSSAATTLVLLAVATFVAYMVLRQGLELTVAGSVIGLLGAAALTRVMASLLFGVSTTDLATFALVPVVLILTAMIASYIPALRATRVDPVVALRDE